MTSIVQMHMAVDYLQWSSGSANVLSLSADMTISLPLLSLHSLNNYYSYTGSFKGEDERGIITIPFRNIFRWLFSQAKNVEVFHVVRFDKTEWDS